MKPSKPATTPRTLGSENISFLISVERDSSLPVALETIKPVAVDINKDAIKYLNENIKLNKLKGNIKTYTGDIREVSDTFKLKFDRIIMNLPGLAYTFLDVAVNLIEDGGIINYYEFSDTYETGIKRLGDACDKLGKKVEIINTRKVKSTSPGEWHIAIDGKITSKK